MPDPGAQLIRLINEFPVSQALYVAAELGISDALADGPKSADELAAATASHAPTLYGMMHALAELGVFEEKPERMFAATRLSGLLRSDRQLPFAAWAEFVGRALPREAWRPLLDRVRNGENSKTGDRDA